MVMYKYMTHEMKYWHLKIKEDHQSFLIDMGLQQIMFYVLNAMIESIKSLFITYNTKRI